jgi:hypothetical protein
MHATVPDLTLGELVQASGLDFSEADAALNWWALPLGTGSKINLVGLGHWVALAAGNGDRTDRYKLFLKCMRLCMPKNFAEHATFGHLMALKPLILLDAFGKTAGRDNILYELVAFLKQCEAAKYLVPILTPELSKTYLALWNKLRQTVALCHLTMEDVLDVVQENDAKVLLRVEALRTSAPLPPMPKDAETPEKLADAIPDMDLWLTP